jgi:F-type H+-transporting ATPase subunit b
MRRITRLLLIAALGVAALVLTPSPAGAVGESVEGCVIEAVQEMVEGKEGLESGSPEYEAISEETEEIVADCIEAPNVLLPEINEVIWGGIGFIVVLLFMLKFGFPAAKKAMTDRTAKIQADLDAAEQAKADAEAVKADYESKVSDAKAEAARIIEEARQSADALKREQEARLQTELAEMRTRAQADIEAAKTNAIADLRGEVAALAVGAAEVIVQRNLDASTQAELVESYINTVAQQRP